MGIVYFVMNKFAALFFGNETEPDYEMMGGMEHSYLDVHDYSYDYDNDYNNDYNNDLGDDKWFYGHMV